MMVGKRNSPARSARGSWNALNAVVISWRETPQVRGQFKGFEIVAGEASSRTASLIFSSGTKKHTRPISTDNPLGTIQSSSTPCRGLDRRAEEEQQEIERQEKALADYRAQLGGPSSMRHA